MYDPLFVEMFDESESPAPTRKTFAESVLDRETFPWERATKAEREAGELLARQLEHRHFVSQMVGTDFFEKLFPRGLVNKPPGEVPPPISPVSYQQESLPVPGE